MPETVCFACFADGKKIMITNIKVLIHFSAQARYIGPWEGHILH